MEKIQKVKELKMQARFAKIELRQLFFKLLEKYHSKICIFEENSEEIQFYDR